MALQDLTPQLRTRLSRMERAVGWFVIVATGLLLFGFGYYIYNRAETKGWFIKKIYYQTCIASGAGLKEGDPVMLMGFPVGEIMKITPNQPYAYYNITVDFRVKAPDFGYIWSDSTAKVAAGDFLGHRYLEITKGVRGVPTIDETNKVALGILNRELVQGKMAELRKGETNEAAIHQLLKAEVENNKSLYYTNLTKKSVYFLEPVESPAVTERLEGIVGQVEAALPNILALTNQLTALLQNSANVTSNLNFITAGTRPAVSNLVFITSELGHPGALGEWLLPANVNTQLNSVMGNADMLLVTANSNLANLNLAIINLADITSNLNVQVQANSNILSSVSSAVTDADTFIQGLKRHWLLRSAFKTKTSPAPPASPRRK